MLPTGRTRATQPQRFNPARPEANSSSRTLEGSTAGGARPDLGAHLPRVGERAGAGVYLSHLPMARGGQAGTALSAYLPPPSPAELTPRPRTGASPVTTTTNKQPPARSHCAGARHLALKTLDFRRGRMSSPPSSVGSGPALRKILPFSLSASKGLTPAPEFFRHAHQAGSLPEQRTGAEIWVAATADWQ